MICNEWARVVVVMDGYVRRFEVVDELIGASVLVNNKADNVYNQASAFPPLLTLKVQREDARVGQEGPTARG